LPAIFNAAVRDLLAMRDCGIGLAAILLPRAISIPSALVDRSAAHYATRLGRARARDATAGRFASCGWRCSGSRPENSLPGSCERIGRIRAVERFGRQRSQVSACRCRRRTLLSKFVRLFVPASLTTVVVHRGDERRGWTTSDTDRRSRTHAVSDVPAVPTSRLIPAASPRQHGCRNESAWSRSCAESCARTCHV